MFLSQTGVFVSKSLEKLIEQLAAANSGNVNSTVETGT